MNATHIVIATDDDIGARLDKFLVARLPEFSRSRLQSLIENGCVACNGTAIEDANVKVKRGQEFTVTVPEAIPSHLLPQDIALNIIYEDDDLLIINKQAGLTVHPGAGNPDNTLVNALLAHCGDSLSGIGGVARPGIVHRIDKDTSGLLVVAKNDVSHVHLSKQLADRSLKRTYTALVWGVPKLPSGTVTGNIGRSPMNRQKMALVKKGGKAAVTHYKVTKDFGALSLLECQLETGRTHQIRVHMAHIGHALVGDPVYGQATAQRLKASAYKTLSDETKAVLLAFHRQALHAKALTLIHPKTGEKMRFTCKPPADMQTLMESLSTE